MANETMERIDKMIESYNLVLYGSDKVATHTDGNRLKKNADDFAFLQENKAAFLSRIPELEAEMLAEYKAKEAATVRFYSGGWESHEIVIDTRKDVDMQLQNTAKLYPHDCSYDSLKKDYERHIEETVAKVTKKAEAERIENERVAKIKATAAETGEKQIIKNYMDECNDPDEECNVDSVTVWAMPDGSVTETRQHTW